MDRLLVEDIRSLNFPLGQYAVTGGAVLAVHGIRKNGDIDILVTNELYEQLKRDGWEEKYIPAPGVCADFSVLQKGNYEAFTLRGFDSKHYNCDVDYQPDNKVLIESADFIDEVPFITLEDLRMFKIAYAREKDLRDVEMIDAHLEMLAIVTTSKDESVLVV